MELTLIQEWKLLEILLLKNNFLLFYFSGICLNSFIKKIIATVKAIKSVRGVA